MLKINAIKRWGQVIWIWMHYLLKWKIRCSRGEMCQTWLGVFNGNEMECIQRWKNSFFCLSAQQIEGHIYVAIPTEVSWGTRSQTACMTEWFLESESGWASNTNSRRNRSSSGTVRVRECSFIFHPRLLKGSFVWSLIQMSLWISRKQRKKGLLSPLFTPVSLFSVEKRCCVGPSTCLGKDRN